MPSIEIKNDELIECLGKKLSISEIEEALSQIGFDVEKTTDEGIIKAEYNPNRPDYCTLEGIVRQLKGYLDLELGLPQYTVKEGNITLKVDTSVSKIRPYIVCGVVKNLSFDDKKIQQIMKIQEDLHWLVGRKRLKAAIGVHDIANIKPPFKYFATKPDEISFVPLSEEKKMTLKEILQKHPKGIEFSHLVDKYDKYPVIVDSENNVLSFPPIINGILTQVTENTKDLFLEITGVSFQNIKMSLNILSTFLADQGGKLESVKVIYPDQEIKTPELKPENITLSKNKAVKLLGLKLNDKQIINLLRKNRFDAELKQHDEETQFNVYIPPYRFDILHEVDIIEEIAIGFGYKNIKPTYDFSMTVAKPNRDYTILDNIRQVLVGLGLIEVVNLTLTNEDDHYSKMLTSSEHVQLMNPISSEYTMVRDSVLPSLLKVLNINRHAVLPQKIFEIGDIVKISKTTCENKTERMVNIAFAVMDDISDFTVIRQISDAFLFEIGLSDITYNPIQHESFLAGRVASVEVNGVTIGLLGEIHPQVLNNFEVDYPVSAAEFYFKAIKEIIT
ncbi:MAG: phenylalanine--tRNA ligase subunit beta [Candidatus Odinarchaeia archaeon]